MEAFSQQELPWHSQTQNTVSSGFGSPKNFLRNLDLFKAVIALVPRHDPSIQVVPLSRRSAFAGSDRTSCILELCISVHESFIRRQQLRELRASNTKILSSNLDKMDSHSVTPASPKPPKIKPAQYGVPVFGCCEYPQNNFDFLRISPVSLTSSSCSSSLRLLQTTSTRFSKPDQTGRWRRP